MGGSGGGSYTDWNRDQLSKAVREDSEKSAAEFDTQLADYLGELLSMFNTRDRELVNSRLDEAKTALQDDMEATLDQIFGGSVAKRTYIDGFSDIDSLLILKASKFDAKSPEVILTRMESILRDHLADDVRVEHGKMAVTLTYPDGMQIQLLPAIQTESGLRVPSGRHDGWSDINPNAFQNALKSRNAECGGRLVPTIKLAKAVVATLPEKYQLSGYHIESMAIAAFRGYNDTKTTERMLPLFFEHAKSIVRSPIRDKTGQSIHVDEYLGEENSSLRQELSHILSGIAKRMRNASAAKSKSQWKEIFGDE